MARSCPAGLRDPPARTVGSPQLGRCPGPPRRSPAFTCKRAQQPARPHSQCPLCAGNPAGHPKGTPGMEQEQSGSASPSGKDWAHGQLPSSVAPGGTAPSRSPGPRCQPTSQENPRACGCRSECGRASEESGGCGMGQLVMPGRHGWPRTKSGQLLSRAHEPADETSSDCCVAAHGPPPFAGQCPVLGKEALRYGGVEGGLSETNP